LFASFLFTVAAGLTISAADTGLGAFAADTLESIEALCTAGTPRSALVQQAVPVPAIHSSRFTTLIHFYALPRLEVTEEVSVAVRVSQTVHRLRTRSVHAERTRFRAVRVVLASGLRQRYTSASPAGLRARTIHVPMALGSTALEAASFINDAGQLAVLARWRGPVTYAVLTTLSRVAFLMFTIWNALIPLTSHVISTIFVKETFPRDTNLAHTLSCRTVITSPGHTPPILAVMVLITMEVLDAGSDNLTYSLPTLLLGTVWVADLADSGQPVIHFDTEPMLALLVSLALHRGTGSHAPTAVAVRSKGTVLGPIALWALALSVHAGQRGRTVTVTLASSTPDTNIGSQIILNTSLIRFA